mgnify:FL=1
MTLFNFVLSSGGLILLVMAGLFGATMVQLDVKRSREIAKMFFVGAALSVILGFVGIFLLCGGMDLSWWWLILSPLPGFIGMFIAAPGRGR